MTNSRWPVLVLFAAWLAVEQAPCAPLDLKIPAQHPYLLVTRAEVEKARERASQSEAAMAAWEAVIQQAKEIAAQPRKPLPERGDTAHWQVAERLVQAGLGYAFGNDPALAECVAQGLLAYADLYPTLPWTNRRCRVFHQSSLYEAMWLENVALAYDLVADSGALTPDQRKHVENDLLRKAAESFNITDYDNDPRIKDLHYRCYNFQAWHLGAVGLAGLALRDPELADWAVNSRFGLKHLIAHDIRDDGLFWERSVGYHHFVISALLPFTEAMFRCGVNLYSLEMPGEGSRNEGCYYSTDTSAAPKSLRMMFRTPFYLAFPDLSFAALGDSNRGPLRPDPLTFVAWNRFREPCLAWMLRRKMGSAARAGFLHYYRYHYRYDDVQLNGHPMTWGRQDETYEVQGNSVVACDGGAQQPDHYLLNADNLGDFTLEWSMTRLQDLGKDERAWVVFQCNPNDSGERKCFALSGRMPEVGRSYHFRLTSRNGQARLEQDGKDAGSRPTVYYAQQEWRHLIYDEPSLDPEQVEADRLAVWRDQSVGNSGEFRNGCTLLPASGLIVLRETAGNFTAEPASTAVALSYGPYGGGHGHPDKLGIVVYSQGRQWIPNYGSMPYETHWKREWTSHSVSHNTLVVDGVSQQPAGTEDKMWPVDSSEQRVQGMLERFDPTTRIASAFCDTAYPGLTMKRQVRLREHCVVDRLEAAPNRGDSAAEHQFDSVLHIDGSFLESSLHFEPVSGALGTRCGYQLVDQLRTAAVENPSSVTFAAGKERLRIWILPQKSPTQLFLGQGPTNSPEERKPMLILRQKGTRARFETVVEPLGQKDLNEKAVWEMTR